ncbi:outer membrane protein [Gammaproteobacteria bacterium]
MTMKIRGFIITASFIIGSIITPSALAVNLIDVYRQALSSDPTFKAARAQWLSDRETLSIKRAALFPQLGAQGSTSGVYSSTELQGPYTDYHSNTSVYSLTLTQPLFHFGDWANVWQAQALTKKAEVTFLAAAEDLLLRTAKAYFNVLQAKDMLSFTTADREALERMLNQTKHKYAVGLIAITDLENAKADYDNAIAKEIAAINDLCVSFEKLGEITGIRYLSLDSVKETFPLLSPKPADIEKWAKAAEQQNFDLAAKRYATIMAKENIKIQTAGHLPTIDANGNYAFNYKGSINTSNPGHQKNASAGLALNLPLFQGGLVLASVRQANYQYQKAISDQETTHRSVVSSTRQAYLTVLSNISQIKARRQAIKSAQSSLRATIAGYEAGTRTMVEVLQEQAKLYDRQKDFAVSEYTYITQFLTLKQLTGILDINDFMKLNLWLEKPQTNDTAPKKRDKLVKKQTLTVATSKKIDATSKTTEINADKPTIEQPAATSPKTSLNTDSDTKQIISTPTTNISTDTQSIDKATETSIEQRVAVTPNPSENTQPAINSNIKPTTSAPTTNTSTNKATEAPPTAKTITSQQATITTSTNSSSALTALLQ